MFIISNVKNDPSIIFTFNDNMFSSTYSIKKSNKVFESVLSIMLFIFCLSFDSTKYINIYIYDILNKIIFNA